MSRGVKVRLVGEKHPNQGRAEYHNGTHWGTICDRNVSRGGWPSVLCHELGGYSRAATVRQARSTSVGAGQGPITRHNLRCRLAQGVHRIDNCSEESNVTQCSHEEDIYVECKGMLISDKIFIKM